MLSPCPQPLELVPSELMAPTTPAHGVLRFCPSPPNASDLQNEGNKLYKDLKAFVSAVKGRAQAPRLHPPTPGNAARWSQGGPRAPLPFHALNFCNPTAVMHESSRKVTETLQEIYSPDWDGHAELKAIADVSPPRGQPPRVGGRRASSRGSQPGTSSRRGGERTKGCAPTHPCPLFVPAEQ